MEGPTRACPERARKVIEVVMDAILNAEVGKGFAEAGLSPPGVISRPHAEGVARQRMSVLADTRSAEVEMEEQSRALEAGAGPAVDQTGPLQSWHGTTVQAPDLSSWGRQHYSLMPICECQATNGYSIANRCFIAPLPTLGVLEADACAWNPGQGLRLSRDLSHEDGMCHPTC